MRKLEEFISYSASNHYYSYSPEKDKVYNNIRPSEMKKLNDYCMKNYGNTFLRCKYEEQSLARSILSSDKEDIEAQDDKDSKF